MIAIAKRDFFSYLHTFIGWLFIAVLWAFMSFFIASNNILGLSSTVGYAISIAEIAFLILMPILCMRSFADEQKQRTDQMLFTAPVSVGKVVMGKFLGLAAVYTIPVLALCIYPVLFKSFGTVPLMQNYIAILGLWVYGLLCIAVCVFASSLTEGSVIAAVLGFAILLIDYLIPDIQNMMSNSSGIIYKVLSALCWNTRYEDFLSGTFSLTALIYLITVTALFLFLTTQVIQKRRYSISKKTLSIGAFSSAMIVVMCAIVVVVNMAAAQLPESLQTIDMTSNKMYSLTKDTKKLVTKLDEDVQIYVLVAEKSKDETLDKTLKQYESLSDHVKVSYVNPATDPTFVQKYTDDTSSLYSNSLIVVSDKRNKVVNYSDIWQTSVDYSTYQTTTTGYDGEGQITSAIDYVTKDDMSKVYVLTGHGETDLGSNFTAAMTKMNIEYADLDLMQNDAVPEDAQTVIVNGPTTDLSSDDLSKLEDYAGNGGNLIMVTNYKATADLTNYKSLMSYYGVTLGDGVVLDSDANRYYQYQSYLLPIIGDSQVTTAVSNGYVMMPFSQPLTYDAEAEGMTYTDILTTSSKGYVHSNADTEDGLAATDSDTLATQTIALQASKSLGDDKTSTALVFSCVNAFSDAADQMVSGSNATMFKGALGQVTSDADTISIDVKSTSGTTLTIATGTALIFIGVFVILIPLVLIIVGLTIWIVRRKK